LKKVFWFTGLSGAGKTTLALELEKRLLDKDERVVILDGDDLRQGLNKNLGFSDEDRKENLRRASEVAKLFAKKGHLVLASFITPFNEDRGLIRETLKDYDYYEIFVECSLKKCMERDPKGFYQKVKDGLIKNYTGIDSIFETPNKPDIIVNTEKLNINETVNLILNKVYNV